MAQKYPATQSAHFCVSRAEEGKRRQDEKPTRRPVGIHERALRPRGDYQLPELPDFWPDDLW